MFEVIANSAAAAVGAAGNNHMAMAIIIFLVTYFFIATEKVDKTIAALLGAGLAVGLQVAPFEELLHKIDLNVIGLLIGMMMIVDIMSTTGVFEWIAIVIAKRAKGNVMLIVFEFLVVTALLSAMLDNVTTVILIAPITILIAQILEVPAVPILVLEAVFSNIGGTSTLVGDPPNILIGSSCGLTFNDFIIHLAPVVVVIMLFSLVFVWFFMRKHFRQAKGPIERIARTKPERAITEPVVLKRAMVVFSLVIVGFFLSRLINVEPGVIALCGALLMAVVCRGDIHHLLSKVEWATIMFFVGLFMLIGALEANHVFELLGGKMVELTRGNLLLTVVMVLWASAILSAIVDNIPLVIAMIPLIKSIVPVFAERMGTSAEAVIRLQIEEPLLWALALGACLGGNGSLIGASANVVIAQVARRNKYKLSFMDFTKIGLPLMVLRLIISTAYLYLRYF